MELLVLFYVLPYAGLFLLFSLSLTILFKSKSKAGGNLAPGNTGLPFIGESIDYLSMGEEGRAEEAHRGEDGQVLSHAFKTSLFGARTIVLCGAPGNKHLFSNENKLVTAWWPSSINKVFPSSNQTSSNEEMKKMRKLHPSSSGQKRFTDILCF